MHVQEKEYIGIFVSVCLVLNFIPKMTLYVYGELEGHRRYTVDTFLKRHHYPMR